VAGPGRPHGVLAEAFSHERGAKTWRSVFNAVAGWLDQKIVGGGERISHGIPTYATSPAVQRVPGSVSWGVFDSVSHGWDSALSEEFQPVRHMIRVRSSGRGASSRVCGVMEVRGFTSLSERLPLAEVAPASTDFTRLPLTQCLNWTGHSTRRSVIR